MRLNIASEIIFFSWALSLLTAGLEELKGNDKPIASIADAIVLAVYIPPQAPGPGHDLLITLS